MLFENPAVAAKLPFPYNVPPPIQAAAATLPMPNLRYMSPDKMTPVTVPLLPSANIANEALIHHDLHNALVAIKSEQAVQHQTQAAQQQAVVQQQQQQQDQQVQRVQQQQQQQQQLQQQQQGGAVITQAQSDSSGRSTPNNSDPAPGKLFVGGLSWQTSSEKLQEYFGVFGNVTDVLIMKDPVTQRSRGFGFITFAEPSSVENVLKVPIHVLDGKKIDPKHATPKNRPRQSHRTKKIFVGGVSQDTSADEVKAYFNQFGKVEETVMLMDQQTKRHRGFGFVTFENEDVVDRVCEIHFHTIKNKKVECKKAQPKEAVTPAAQLLQKRLMLGGLGVRMVAPPTLQGPGGVPQHATQMQLVQVQAQAAQAAATAAAFQAQNVAAAGYGTVFSAYPQALHSFRYSPYAMPATAAAAHAAHAAATAQQQHHQQQTTHQQHPAQPQQATTQQIATAAANVTGAPNPYQPQAYGLPNVDMSSFQNVDWSSMYGMGMYV